MQVSRHSNLRLPEALRQKLISFRRRLWALKLVEAFAAAVIAVLVGFMLTYLLDRLHDTSPIVRFAILVAAVFGCLSVPLAIHRWIIRRRRLDQLARLLATTRPNTGDQLLGVIELADENLNWDHSEQSRSPQLVEAAIEQVAANVADQDLTSAIPDPRHQRRSVMALGLGLVVLLLFLLTTPAAKNAWARFVAPWIETPRYTFAQVEPLPEAVIVAQDEPFSMSVQLKQSSRWNPSNATALLSGYAPRQSQLAGGQYSFSLPGQLSQQTVTVNVGDFSGQVRVDPLPRPELSSLTMTVRLPEYLGRSEPITKEVRGSTVSVLKGSQAALQATVSRELDRATVNGVNRATSGDRFSSQPIPVEEPAVIQMEWQDTKGLSGREPFELRIEPTEDAAPVVACENLPRAKVLLDSEVIAFQVRAQDDYGIKRVGLEWHVIDHDDRDPEVHESIIGAGGTQVDSLELAATFSAVDQQVDAPTVAVRVFVEDYLPGRVRSYSAESIFDILSADQHAIWVTDQLTRWQRMSLDARDRELQLYESNKELRAMTDQQLQQSENQARLARQAQLERSGSNQLASLVRNGETLLKEAMRNSGIGVEQLDRWAEMIQTLKQISENRMPSVAELLQQAAKKSAANAAAKAKQAAGQNRLTQQGSGEADSGDDEQQEASQIPTISDVESSQNDLNAGKSGEPSESKQQPSSLTLPSTMLASPANPQQGQKLESPKQEIDQAVKEQESLLAEFDKIADELNQVLANLEGSTIVKRLKASSRQQQRVAAELALLASDSFGVSDRKKAASAEAFQVLAAIETTSSEKTSHIMDDMDAYFQRSRIQDYQRVLDQMRESDVTAELRLLSDELRKENGLSISQAEYWSDTFDRWAEDLVGASDSGQSPAGKAKGSMPPAVILEVLKLLEAEVNLRERTRVAEQARPALSHTEFIAATDRLWQTQDQLQQRIDTVIDQIRELPDAQADFGKELGMLSKVSKIMIETVEILRKPDTGPDAIAAETEIIEMLLESKRFSPSGGGGGAAPGGGGKGDTETPALALVGTGVNVKEFREEMSAVQATGANDPSLPEEYRSGLDAYFNQLEVWRSGR